MTINICNRLIWRRLALYFLPVTVLHAATSSVFAQTASDPLEVSLSERQGSELPTWYGFILGGQVCLFDIGAAITEDGDAYANQTPRFLTIELHAYYDAWQIGFAARHHGNFGVLSFRSIGKDSYSAAYLEAGHISGFTLRRDFLDSSETSITQIGVGYGSTGSYSSSPSPGVRYSLGLGLAFIPETIYHDRHTLPYSFNEVGLGMRIPFDQTAVTISVNLQLGIVPLRGNGHITGEVDIFSNIGISTMFGLNFEQ